LAPCLKPDLYNPTLLIRRKALHEAFYLTEIKEMRVGDAT
jgi:hypothetical protein